MANDAPPPPFPPPATGGAGSASQFPTIGPPPRSRSGVGLWALMTALGVVVLLLAVSLVYFDPLPGSTCNDWWVYCPRSPGNTPIGSALEFGNTTAFNVAPEGAAKPGCQVPAGGTEYCEAVRINETSSNLSTSSVGFRLSSSDAPNVPFVSVTLLDSGDRGVAQYTLSGGWVACTPLSCGVAPSPVSLPTVLTIHMEFVLDGGSSYTLPNGLAGYMLSAVGTGSFQGTVSVGLT
jgi:hypothetical protein